jgi:hypothetical protein
VLCAVLGCGIEELLTSSRRYWTTLAPLVELINIDP